MTKYIKAVIEFMNSVEWDVLEVSLKHLYIATALTEIKNESKK